MMKKLLIANLKLVVSALLVVGVVESAAWQTTYAAAPSGAPAVTIARDGVPLLPIFFLVGKLSPQDLAKPIDQWRQEAAAAGYKLANRQLIKPAGKGNAPAKGTAARTGNAPAPEGRGNPEADNGEDADSPEVRELKILRVNARNLVAADDLKRCLNKMTGGGFEIHLLEQFPANPGPGIYVGTVPDFTRLDLPQDLGPQDSLLRTTAANQVILVAGRKESLFYGVYAFLDRLGCRWFFPSQEWETVPQRKDVTVTLDERPTPDFSLQRKLAVGFGVHSKVLNLDFSEWNDRNRMTTPFALTTSEGWPGISRDDFEKHPAWFAEVGGKRMPSKPCYANPEVIELGIKNALGYFEKHPDAFMVSVNPPDGVNFCECELCKMASKVVRPSEQGNIWGYQTDGTLVALPSETMFHYANLVADAVQKKYPGRMVGTCAYSFHSHPPSFDLRPNLYVEITTQFRRTPLSMEEQLDAFSQRCRSLGIYEYYDVDTWSKDRPGVAKAAHLDYLENSLQFLYGKNVRSVRAEMSLNWAPNGLGYYMSSRLFWNIRTDVAAEKENFYRQAFGPAAESIRRIYQRWEDGFPYDNRDVMALTYRDLQAAVEKTADEPEYRARVDRIRMYVHFLKHYVNPAAKSFEKDPTELFGPNYEPEKARRQVAELAEYVCSIMDTGMIHSYGFNFFLMKLGDAMGCANTKKWKNPGRIPTAAEVEQFFRTDLEELQGIDFAKLPEVAPTAFGKEVVSVKVVRPALLPPTVAPIESSEMNDVWIMAQANRGETVRVKLQPSPKVKQDIEYAVHFATAAPAELRGKTEKFGAHRIKTGTLTENEIRFQAPETGFYHITWKTRSSLSTGTIEDVSHPCAIVGQGFNWAKLYFFVPKGTQRFCILTISRDAPTISIKDDQGIVRAESKGSGNGKKINKAKRAAGKDTVGPTAVEGAAGNPAAGDEADESRSHILMVDVPAGSDDAIWSLEGPYAGFAHIKVLGATPFLSLRPDLLLVPQDALK